MKPKEFFDKLDDNQIVAAIRDAERKTSGEIRVFVTDKKVANAVTAAEQAFTRLGMAKTRERNGVLIFIAPRAQQFAVIGDEAVHRRCGESFWRELAEEMSSRFKIAHFTDGIVHIVHKAGALLAEHFPRRSDDRNELSDRVHRD